MVTDKRFRSLALCLCPLLLSACTIVHIDGESRVSTVKFGVLRIEPKEGAKVIVYRAKGIGIVPGHSGVTLGASDETAALILSPDDCRIILFQPKPEDLDALLKILATASTSPDTVCIRGTRP